MDKSEWSGVSRSADEDIALTSTISDYRLLTPVRTVLFLVMSAAILGVYLLANHAFFPGYPVLTPFAEENTAFAEHYPPFRLHEWTSYVISQEIMSGTLFDWDSYARRHPIGFPLLSVPLTIIWGKAGPYYTNAIILWLSALFFFLFILEIVPFPIAFASTLVLAFASPNLFFATSAFPEPLAQLFTILSLLFFIKGMSSGQELRYFTLAGLFAGLNLFVQPIMAVIVLLFVAILLYEQGKWAFSDWIIYMLVGGFIIPLLAFCIMNKLMLGSFAGHLLSPPYLLGTLTPPSDTLAPADISAGLWKLFFDNPHGLLFIMPVIMLVPCGFIVMWRFQMKALFVVSTVFITVMILFTAAFPEPNTDECIGSRQLLAVMPLFIVPLALIWDEYIVEKICLGVTLFLTVYMSTFGWWADIRPGKGFFIKPLADREAGVILQARKNQLRRPVFPSTSEIERRFYRSLERRDMKKWLQTLDRESVESIRGVERAVFDDLVKKYDDPGFDRTTLIESIDPDHGIRLAGPEVENKTTIERNGTL